MDKIKLKVFKIDCDGTLCVTNLHWTRRECIKDSESNFQKTWKELKKYGHQVVKVKVTEVS